MLHTLGDSGFIRLADGRALHVMKAGIGGPTVVFESGLGASRSEWGLVQPLVARQFSTVVYDRANLGRSDDDGAPRTLERLTHDLGELLDALDAAPYILVGHSYGGTIALATAAQNRSDVAGLVLVDHSDEQLDVCCGPSLKRLHMLALAGRWSTDALRRLHLLPLAVRRAAPGMPADVVDDLVAEDLTVRARQAAETEEEFFLQGLASLRRRPPKLGDMPVTVISATRSTLIDRSIRKAFLGAHEQAAARLGARLVKARKSGHQVVFTEPHLVADEIIRIAGAPSSPRDIASHPIP
ncbi:alpha/beta fold hydrolase [Mycobacteroides saopaulense]|uniref:alpha/beta fold hydrolase n=1 Tax=Mycobacteroides saopaulense TaxID=1578165 RepID=UPI000D694BB1|nr:alpha/beta hydrolase [Mycobacteroides saopaulense]